MPTTNSNPTTSNAQRPKTQVSPWIGVIALSLIMGSAGGFVTYTALSSRSGASSSALLSRTTTGSTITVNSTDESSPVVDAASKSVDSVVSIVATREITRRGSLFDRFFNNDDGGSTTSRQQIAAGTGFVVTDDGYIITNRHVVDDTVAEYTVIFNNGTETPGTVVARDTVLDIAFVKVDPANLSLKPLPLGVSKDIKVGQTAIAIGNSLGEFSNTVSRGIISGLNRTIQAGDAFGGNVENLENIIQTDASINSGNSGGPLLDIAGNVIGVNVAKVQDGENIGFAIPIDAVKPILDSVLRTGKIVRPYIGVRYIDVNPALAKARGLGRDYGALIEGTTQSNAIVPGSPADRAGLKAGDIILEINGIRITETDNLRSVIVRFNINDTVTAKIFSEGQERDVQITLAEAPRN